jgi:hypothetical protein
MISRFLKSAALIVATVSLVANHPPMQPQAYSNYLPAGQSKLRRSPQSLVMAKAFSEGKLPEPAALPPGNADRQAAALAKIVRLQDESSTAALYAAVLASGYAVRERDGSVKQPRAQGQGLILNSWELAATAKLYGEDYGVMLSHLSNAFAGSVPELKDVPLADVLLDGIRAGAQSRQPPVRFLSRFIIELGKHSEPSVDLLDQVDPAKTRLNAIQVALIMSRLAGDLAVAQKQTARVNYSHAKPQSPCPTNDSQDLILDYNALASTTLFGILTTRLGGKIKAYGGGAGIANIVAAVFKFILSYSMLDVEITMDGEEVVRPKDKSPGAPRTLTAKLKIDKSPWEQLNCLRPVFNAAGLDLEFPKSGPLADTTVAWSIVLGGDSRGALGTAIDLVTGEDDRDDLIYLKPKPGSHPMPNKQTADSNGVSVIDVVGAPQKEDLSRRKVFEVYKAGGVTVGVQIKPMKIKDAQAALSTLTDITGNVLSFLTGDPVGGGLGVVFETMYRSNWYSAKPFYFPVKDWEPCNGQWQGTISYTYALREVGSAESNVVTQSWNDEEHYDSEIQISGLRTNLGAALATVKATASRRRERISTGKGVCYRTSTQIDDVKGSDTVVTTGWGVTVNPRTQEYRVSPPAIVIEASGSESVVSEVKGTCNNPYNKNLRQGQPVTGMKLTAEGPTVVGLGRIDPHKPDEISGTNTVTIPTNKGGERTVTITWSLKRCKDQ